MRYALISLRSLTYVQRAARILERAGLFAAPARVPRHLSDTGCGYALKVRWKDTDDALSILREAGFRTGKIVGLSEDGKASVVEP